MNIQYLERLEEFLESDNKPFKEKIDKVVFDRFAYVYSVIDSNDKSFNFKDDVLKFLFESLSLFYTNQLIDNYAMSLESYEIEIISFYKDEVSKLYPIYFEACNSFNYDNHPISIHAMLILPQYYFNLLSLDWYLFTGKNLDFNTDDKCIVNVVKDKFYGILIDNISNSEADKELIYKLSLILYISLAIHLAVYYVINSRKKQSIKVFSTISEALFVLKGGVAKDISNYMKKRMATANEARWQGHVEKQRRKYLELDIQRQSDLDKKLSIKDVAMWIYNNRNEFEVEYETIRDHLSKARKGEFTND